MAVLGNFLAAGRAEVLHFADGLLRSNFRFGLHVDGLFRMGWG